MKKIFLIAIGIITFGCSKPSCDEELQKLYNQRAEAYKNCGSGWACALKVQEDFKKKEDEILRKCD